MDANKAIKLGFADELMQRSASTDEVPVPQVSMMFSRTAVLNSLMDKNAAKCLSLIHILSKLFSKKMEKVKDGTSNQRNVAQSGRHYISRIAPSNHTAVRKVLDGSNSP